MTNIAATKKKRTTVILLVMVAAMFGFGFALVPLYDLLCELTGINGKVELVPYEAENVEVDEERSVSIQFIAMNNSGMPWKFKPNHSSIKVNPGASTSTSFFAHNPTQNFMVGQAVPSISPSSAAKYFHKIECFCFNQQELASGSQADLGLQFFVDKELPKNIHTITLTYTLFDVTQKVASSN